MIVTTDTAAHMLDALRVGEAHTVQADDGSTTDIIVRARVVTPEVQGIACYVPYDGDYGLIIFGDYEPLIDRYENLRDAVNGILDRGE